MSVVINAVGDFILNAFGQTGEDPFEFVYDQLRDCDILFGNNETVISEYDQRFYQKAYSIRTTAASSKYLTKAGFDVVHFANNHCFDFGVRGAADTLEEFRRLGLPSLGVGLTPEEAERPAIIERDGLKIGFYGIGNNVPEIEQDGAKAYSNTPKNPHLFEQLAELRGKVDVLIVSIHWDNECIDLPNPEVQALGRKFIDSGVDLVLGHHPHIPHGIEKYNGGMIVYSLGNFQFKCTIRPELDYSFIFKATLDKGGVTDYELVPLMINPDSRPRPATGKDVETVLEFIRRVSEPLPGGISSEMFEDAACEIFFTDNLNAWAKRIRENGEGQLHEMFEWFTDPVMVHRFWVLMQKRNWTIYDLLQSLGLNRVNELDA